MTKRGGADARTTPVVQTFALALAPSPKRRPRARVVDGRPISYTDRVTHDAEAAIRDALREQGAQLYPPGCALALDVTFSVRRGRKRRATELYPPQRPDLANYVMLVSDAGQGVLWHDDAQLVTIRATKAYATAPSIRLVVAAVPNGSSPRLAALLAAMRPSTAR